MLTGISGKVEITVLHLSIVISGRATEVLPAGLRLTVLLALCTLKIVYGRALQVAETDLFCMQMQDGGQLKFL